MSKLQLLFINKQFHIHHVGDHCLQEYTSKQINYSELLLIMYLVIKLERVLPTYCILYTFLYYCRTTCIHSWLITEMILDNQYYPTSK